MLLALADADKCVFFRSFDVWGNHLRLTSNDRLILERATQSLNSFLSPISENPVNFCFFSTDVVPLPLKIPASARIVRTGTSSTLFLYKQLWLIDYHGNARFTVNQEDGTVTGYIRARCLEEGHLLNAFLEFVYEFLRKRGLYWAHSGAVSLAGKGLLLAGESGCGKTTSVLRLVAAGFEYVSDEHSFLRRSDTGFEVLASPEPVQVYPPHVADLPELQFLQGDQHRDGPKKTFDIREAYPQSVVDRAALKAIVFPSWDPSAESRLEAVPPVQAMTALLPLTMGPFFSFGTGRTHFDFTSALVEKIPAFRLRLGGDKEKWPDIARGLLQ